MRRPPFVPGPADNLPLPTCRREPCRPLLDDEDFVSGCATVEAATSAFSIAITVLFLVWLGARCLPVILA